MDQKKSTEANVVSNSGKIDERKFARRQQNIVTNPEEDQVGYSPDKRFVKYRTEVGRGAFKTVYIGLDTLTGKQIAWCELPLAKINKNTANSLENEAEMLKSLSHPNILTMYDIFHERSGNLVLITELMTSGTLKKYVMSFKANAISELTLKNFTKQILKGLHYLHSRYPPILHRDLKCDNVFISGSTGYVKIGDYGLSKYKTSSYVESSIGTPEFMAPEMYDGIYDEKVDIYAFGMCFLELITREYPYKECLTAGHIYKKVASGELPECYNSLSSGREKKIIGKCIRFNPAKRPSAKQLLDYDYFRFTKFTLDIVSKDSNDVIINFELQNLDLHRDQNKEDEQIQINEDEAIQFEFNMSTDSPESIALLMVNDGILNNDDIPEVVSLINYRVAKFKTNNPEKIGYQECRSPTTIQKTPSIDMTEVNESSNNQLLKSELNVQEGQDVESIKQKTENDANKKVMTKFASDISPDKSEPKHFAADNTKKNKAENVDFKTGILNIMDIRSKYEVVNSSVVDGKINCLRVVKDKPQDSDSLFTSTFSKEHFDNLRKIFDISSDPIEKAKENNNLSPVDDLIESNIEDILEKATLKTKFQAERSSHADSDAPSNDSITFNIDSSMPAKETPPFITNVEISPSLTPHHKVYAFGFPDKDISKISCLPFIPNLNRKYASATNKSKQISDAQSNSRESKTVRELSVLDAALSNTFYSKLSDDAFDSLKLPEKNQMSTSSSQIANKTIRSAKFMHFGDNQDSETKPERPNATELFRDKFIISISNITDQSFNIEIDIVENSMKLNFQILQSEPLLDRLTVISNALVSQNFFPGHSKSHFTAYLMEIMTKNNLMSSDGKLLGKKIAGGTITESQSKSMPSNSLRTEKFKFNITKPIN